MEKWRVIRPPKKAKTELRNVGDVLDDCRRWSFRSFFIFVSVSVLVSFPWHPFSERVLFFSLACLLIRASNQRDVLTMSNKFSVPIRGSFPFLLVLLITFFLFE